MDYSSLSSSLPTILTTADTQKVDDDLKYYGDDEERQLQHAITATAYRPEVERLPSFTEVCTFFVVSEKP